MITFQCPACGHVEKVGAATPPAPTSPDMTQAAQEVFAGDVAPPKCPTHRFEMKRNSRGFYCSGKTNGKWCEYRVAA